MWFLLFLFKVFSVLLNALLEKTYDAEKGFKKAAENVENPALKNYFQTKAQQRYDFGHELKSEIKSYGQDVDKGGSLIGDAHRAWMDVKKVFSVWNLLVFRKN